MFEVFREYLDESILVILRHLGHTDSVEIDLIFPVKRTTLHAEFKHGSADRCRGNFQDIQVCSWPRESVHHGDDESTHAIQPDFFLRCEVEFAEKREPWLRNGFIGMRTQVVLP